MKNNPWQNQVGGEHYKKLAIQPMEYSLANGLDPLQHTAIKYITRIKSMEDLHKALHCVEMLIYERGKKDDELVRSAEAERKVKEELEWNHKMQHGKVTMVTREESEKLRGIADSRIGS